MLSVKHFKFVLHCLSAIAVTSCADQTGHCLYGISSNIKNVQAKLCDDTIIPYVQNGGFWETSEVISTQCEWANVEFIYEDDTSGEYGAFYFSNTGNKSTSYHQVDTTNPETIHLMKVGWDEGLQECPSEENVNFIFDFTSGENCNAEYYACDAG